MKEILPFSKLVEINPPIKLEKGKDYPFIEMAAVDQNRRYVSTNVRRIYKGGGARFISGDTLFARITPCLEHGKISQYKSQDNSPAFGSTEFFVFRAYPKISDPAYIYYLSKTDLIRKPAEKSMSGASGRQRADIDVIKKLEIPFPSLPVQRKISTILSPYDNLIENNLRRIQILEEIAQNLHREWFVHFRFPGHENSSFVDTPMGKIPEGWEVVRLGNILDSLESGKRPKGGVSGINEGVPSIGAENIIGIGKHDFQSEKFIPSKFFDGMKKGVVKDQDVALYKDGANIGRSTYFRDNFPHSEFSVNEHVFLLRSNNKKFSQNLLYLWLKEPLTIEAIRSTNSNAAQPGINQNGVKGIEIVLPRFELVHMFDLLVEPLIAQIINDAKRNQILCNTRDLLLQQLISGKLDVSSLDLKVEEDAK